MKRIIIKQNNEVKQTADFSSDEKLADFIETLNSGLTAWGKAEYQRELTPRESVFHPAVLDEHGEITTPEYTETIEATYETVPAEFTYEVLDISAEVEILNRLSDLTSKGREFEEVCMDCLRIVGAYNEERNLKIEQILEMGTLFANIEQVLNRRMPKTAKALVSQLTPDGVLVTQELKDLLLVTFQKKGF